MTDIRHFLTGRPSASPAAAAPVATLECKRAKGASKPSALQIPLDPDSHRHPPALDAIAAAQPPGKSRCLWLVPGALSWGGSPMDRLDPCEWMQQHKIRVIVDVSAMLRDDHAYTRAATRAGVVLVHLSINPRLKIPPTTVTAAVALCRALRRMVTDAAAAVEATDTRLALHLCDGQGGGTAALIAAPLLALHAGCSLVDACMLMRSMWRDHMPDGVSMTGRVRVFPEGEWLKAATVELHGRLRVQPLNASASTAACAEIDECAKRLKVLSAARAATRVLDIDPALLLTRPPFSRDHPVRAVTWALHAKEYAERRAFERLDESGSDDDDDDDDHGYGGGDNEEGHRGHRRRHRRPHWNEYESDNAMGFL